MREMWRVSAFDIQEASGKRPKFADLVRLINKQAKIAADPLFGDIKDTEDKGKPFVNMKAARVNRPKGSTFATSVAPAANENSPENCKGFSRQVISAFQKPCIFCEKHHTLAECLKIRNQPYKGRIEFLKGRAVFFMFDSRSFEQRL